LKITRNYGRGKLEGRKKIEVKIGGKKMAGKKLAGKEEVGESK
jgi:hypothetical protein